MINLTDELKNKFLESIDLAVQLEQCSLLLVTGEIFPCKNIHKDPENNFLISGQDRLAASSRGDIVAVFHTHYSDYHPGYLTYSDIKNSIRENISYILYHTGFESWDLFEPLAINPYPLQSHFVPKDINSYLMWKWQWGRTDCFSLFRSFYNGFLEIDIPQYNRPTERQIYAEGWNTFLEEFPKQGFTIFPRETQIKQYDAILMSIDGVEPHHIGVITNIDRGEMLHIDKDALSRLDFYSYRNFWGDHTRYIARHDNFL